jgi:hypothetical protein
MPQREMQRLSQVEIHGNQVAAHSQAFVAYSRGSSRELGSVLEGGWDGVCHSGQNVPLNGPEEANQARRSTLAHLSQLQTILEQPADFLQRLTRQVCDGLCFWHHAALRIEEMPHTFFPTFVKRGCLQNLIPFSFSLSCLTCFFFFLALALPLPASAYFVPPVTQSRSNYPLLRFASCTDMLVSESAISVSALADRISSTSMYTASR